MAAPKVTVLPSDMSLVFEPSETVIDELLNFELPILPASFDAAIEPANIAFVTVPVSPLATIVPAAAGNVNVISAVEAGPISVTLFDPLSLSSKNSKNLHLLNHFLANPY